MLAIFDWNKLPVGTRFGNNPDAWVKLQRGMSASELDDDDFPVKSRAFRFGKIALIDEVIGRANANDGLGLLELTHTQTMEGRAKRESLDTPFISAAMPNTHAEWHARKHPDGLIVDLEVPASSILVPWMMENEPGRPPYEVHLVGAVPAAHIIKITRLE